MNVVKALAVIVFAVSSSLASAASVSILPGEVGMSGPWWAGVVRIKVGDQEMLAMYDDIRSTDPRSQPLPQSWQATLYTQAEIESGAPVNFAPENYRKAAQFFLQGLLGVNPPDNLWTAGFNEMVWNTAIEGTLVYPLWGWANEVYDEESGTTLHDVYNSQVGGLDPNYNYQASVGVLGLAFDPSTGFQRPDIEMLVLLNGTTISTPVPPAVWLFGSGLLGLVAVARAKIRRA